MRPPRDTADIDLLLGKAYMAWVTAALRDGRWQPLPSPILPEDVVGQGGAAAMRAHGLYPCR